MKKPPHAGFTLVEVLVATALAGVITAISILLMHTTREVAMELQDPLFTPGDRFRQHLQQELDHLLPEPPFEDQSAVELSSEAGLTLISLQPDEQGIPHAMRIRYILEGQELLRTAEGGHPMLTTTNTVLRSLRGFSVTAFREGEPFDSWPPGNSSLLPDRIEVRVDPSTGQERSASLHLPAAFRIEARSEETGNGSVDD